MKTDFFRFLSGFVGLIFISLSFIFAIGFYESQVMGTVNPDELSAGK